MLIFGSKLLFSIKEGGLQKPFTPLSKTLKEGETGKLMGEVEEGDRIETGIDTMAVVRGMIDHINLEQGTIRGIMNRGEGMAMIIMDGNEDEMIIKEEVLAKDKTGGGDI